MSKERVVVTGLGIVTALGTTVPKVWRRLAAGENGVTRITYFDASQYSSRVAAEVRLLPATDGDSLPCPPDHCRRGVRLFLHAAREAHADARLVEAPLPVRRMGVAAGTSVNYVNMRLIRRDFPFRRAEPPHVDVARLRREAPHPRLLFPRRLGDMTSVVAARALGLGGPTLAIDTACAASAYAVGEAFRMIQRGQADAMVAGGACSVVSPVGILAFSVLGALSSNPDPDLASRPFDRRRDGFVRGEGAGAVVLERHDHARARGARVYGEVAGFGSTLNASNLTDPSPDGASEERAMRLAMADASTAPEEIDYVAAHGTSTPKNDAVETGAIKRAFGSHARRLLVSSNKGQIGHTISAAGVCSLIFAFKAMEDGWVPPTAHLHEPDPQCDLDYVPNVGRRAPVRAALVNAFAFGGQNAALVVKAA